MTREQRCLYTAVGKKGFAPCERGGVQSWLTDWQGGIRKSRPPFSTSLSLSLSLCERWRIYFVFLLFNSSLATLGRLVPFCFAGDNTRAAIVGYFDDVIASDDADPRSPV